MGMTDTVTKEYMRGNKVFADAFNYLIYGGEQVVKPALLQELDTTEIAIPFALDEEENTTEEAVQKYRDVLKSTVIMQESIQTLSGIYIMYHDTAYHDADHGYEEIL